MNFKKKDKFFFQIENFFNDNVNENFYNFNDYDNKFLNDDDNNQLNLIFLYKLSNNNIEIIISEFQFSKFSIYKIIIKNITFSTIINFDVNTYYISKK